MTINEALHRINNIKPNSYSESEKIKWLSTLDGLVSTEILEATEETFKEYSEDKDLNTTLLIPAPYDEVYLYWLEAKINYWNGEYGKYNNSMEMYNEALSNYAKYYNRTCKPKKGKRFIF